MYRKKTDYSLPSCLPASAPFSLPGFRIAIAKTDLLYVVAFEGSLPFAACDRRVSPGY
jgi:hypothetical protein